jgi:hypothetical protein
MLDMLTYHLTLLSNPGRNGANGQPSFLGLAPSRGLPSQHLSMLLVRSNLDVRGASCLACQRQFGVEENSRDMVARSRVIEGKTSGRGWL